MLNNTLQNTGIRWTNFKCLTVLTHDSREEDKEKQLQERHIPPLPQMNFSI